VDHTLSTKTAKFTSLENLYEYGIGFRNVLKYFSLKITCYIVLNYYPTPTLIQLRVILNRYYPLHILYTYSVCFNLQRALLYLRVLMFGKQVIKSVKNHKFIKPGTRRPKAGVQLVSWNYFYPWCENVRLSVCLSLRLLITSGMMWCDIEPFWLFKQLLGVFLLFI